MSSSLAGSLPGSDPVTWAIDFLHALGKPATPQNVEAIVAWEYAESGGGGGMFNPLNTTQGGFGGTSINSAGVKNYPTYADGLAASVKVINNGLYGGILRALDSGTSAQAVWAAVVASPWGTKHIGPVSVSPGQISGAHPGKGGAPSSSSSSGTQLTDASVLPKVPAPSFVCNLPIVGPLYCAGAHAFNAGEGLAASLVGVFTNWRYVVEVFAGVGMVLLGVRLIIADTTGRPVVPRFEETRQKATQAATVAAMA